MRHLTRRAASLGRMALRGELQPMISKLRVQLRSEHVAMGLARDLLVPHPVPRSRWALTVRPLEPDDVLHVFGVDEPGNDEKVRQDLMDRLALLEAGLGRCWVALTPDETPCFVQWMFLAIDNEALDRVFGGIFPELGPTDALLEGAFTVPRFRGLGIMPAAMAQIAERARPIGATRALSFSDHRNAVSIKAAQQAGFVPYAIRIARWRLFSRSVSFSPVSPVATPVRSATTGAG